MGPLTGRRMGLCSGYGAPGYMWPGPGMGYGRGRGFGRGFGSGFFGHPRGTGRFWGLGAPGYEFYPPPPISAEDELRMLKDETKALSRRQKQITQRIEELEKKG